MAHIFLNLKRLRRLACCIGLFFLIVAGGCSTAKRGEPISGPLNLDTEQLERGQLVFMQHCQKCHPGGEAGVGLPINNVPLPKGLLKFRVRSKAFLLGLGRMPSFKEEEISDRDLEALVSYIKELKKNKPLEENLVKQ
ncbi:c-type cytochrome [Pontibacter litorisediminis]|uniref:c-type cytochrome n=1 Tax=Pontibacter litorisediminis TaxID=1846260 RepID=UPI0023EAC667|nr:cytochrome c [Pontibacter litorisediminis]